LGRIIKTLQSILDSSKEIGCMGMAKDIFRMEATIRDSGERASSMVMGY